MTRRLVAVTVAIVLAALGTIGGIFLVFSADSRARSAINDAVTVAVTIERINAGTTGATVRSANLVRFEKYPRTSVPSDALSEIPAELDQLVLLSTLPAGRILTRASFGDRSQVTSGLNLPEGKMAVTVATGSPEQVAGFVRPGSLVAIFLTYEVRNSAGRGSGLEKTRVLLPKVGVLAIGSNTSQNDSATSSRSALVTVAVTQAEAERLIEGASHGTLYLGLLTDTTKVTTGGGVDNTDSGGNTTPLFP